MKYVAVLLLSVVLVSAGPVPSWDEVEPKEQSSGKYEGDIVLTAEQEEQLLNPLNGQLQLNYRWPGGVIPYEIIEEHFTQEQVAMIRRALRLIQVDSCLRFVPRTNQRDYIRVIGNDSGCWSYVGNLRRGVQELHLYPDAPNTGCFRMGTIIHEFLHALGFFHMQSDPHRDDYVDIRFENIIVGTENNFRRYTEDVVGGFGVDYDYGSVMHYGRTAFSKNGEDTIVPHDPEAVIGQRAGMSPKDVQKLQIMYDCPIPY
ncbi:blastula protease 10-like [Uranotaenia lowii]|uniref:blastula protease 10-like n=1 Tax=Uranotaenia lowii TaxID=190385 RepID=UPI002479B7E2|nr:blastula protease 10-like [Uranotaenia lowii]